jgi:hypothetical protein
LTALSSDILTRRPANSGFLTCIDVTILGFLYVTYSSSLVRILHPFYLLLGHISCLVFSAPVFKGMTSFCFVNLWLIQSKYKSARILPWWKHYRLLPVPCQSSFTICLPSTIYSHKINRKTLPRKLFVIITVCGSVRIKLT